MALLGREKELKQLLFCRAQDTSDKVTDALGGPSVAYLEGPPVSANK